MTIDPEDLDCIIAYAPKLRAAGITSVGVAGVSFTLLEAVDTAPEEPVGTVTEDEPSPLNDPYTFGRRSGVPMRGKGSDS